MTPFLIRFVLGASAFIGHAAATGNVSEDNLKSLPLLMNPNGVACHDEFHITSTRLCVVAAKRMKITKMKIHIDSKFQPPYGCSLKGKTMYFNGDKNAKPPRKSVTPICRILPECYTGDPDSSMNPSVNPSKKHSSNPSLKLSMNPSKRFSVEPSVEPTIDLTTQPSVHPSKFVDPSSTFTFNGRKNIERASGENDYDGTVAKPPTDYVLRFTIEPLGKSDATDSIIHITTGGGCCGGCCDYGTRAPAVFFHAQSSLKLQVFTNYDNGSHAWYSSSTELALNTESEVEIRVVGTTSSLLLNGVVDSTLTVGARSPLSDVKVYFGNPWTTAANAIISKVYFGPA